MKTFVILPARMKSTRLPNKLIKKIGKMTLIEHMITRAKKIKVIKFVTTILVEVKNLPKKLKTDLSAFIAYFG